MDVTPFGDKLLAGYKPARETMEELRHNIAKSGMGVTLQYPFLTVRFGQGKGFKSVTMVVVEVNDDRGPPVQTMK